METTFCKSKLQVYSRKGTETQKKVEKKSSTNHYTPTHTHRGEPSSCTNTSRQCINTIIIYNTTHTHTHTHTIIFDILFLYVLANFFKLGGHSLYTVWNSYLNATYIYIYYIQHKRHGTIASFCVKNRLKITVTDHDVKGSLCNSVLPTLDLETCFKLI